MSAATATETPEKHRERINFTNQTFLRPWLFKIIESDSNSSISSVLSYFSCF
ncbi:unnamed protein product [Meloidogyne enterolobii]|uniref:Uncharacterized protein n=1 Tax=Meloidogyne enterolobii TaxID=390850 RepID=A0ACB0YBN1_MELEN